MVYQKFSKINFMNIPSLTALKKENFQDLETFVIRQKNYMTLKRAIDFLGAAFLIITLLPVFVVLTIFIRLDSPGKAIFVQERIGKNRKRFWMYKFRTMYSDVKNQDFAPKAKGDKRVTPWGKTLRRTHLDELPQLFNILKGEMTFIGPRPEMTFIAKSYTAFQQRRLLVKPGLTGLWQISGKKAMLIHENLEYDLYYIKYQSPSLDLKILLWTFLALSKGQSGF